ncbi:MAG: leucine--tRNA ligase [Saprospiraceae bacterium]|nr:leucine--tRNA ligase [Saprospiraceae bacterium]MBK9630817.1 leucine--tRNA ligase [Saprospiraceae bacterium]
MEYDHRVVEQKWKQKWQIDGVYKVSNDFSLPKYYILDMFPYPSGSGLHVGHPLGYIASDIMSRYKRMSGFNVLHPMGFDAFGLPAEQYAIQTGVHPAVSTAENMERYRDQLHNIGLNYDWDREVITCDPSYYKWTQWIFIQLFEHYYCLNSNQAKPIKDLIQVFSHSGSLGCAAFGQDELNFTDEEWNQKGEKERADILMNYRLAYRKISFVNWCEALGTVLANDEIKDGVSERGGHPVEKKPMMQWALRISAYSERLLQDLNTVEWSESLKTMQRNWIGKSTGAQVFFPLQGRSDTLEVFTTRPDTIFGVSFLVVAPEHPLLKSLCTADRDQSVINYLNQVNKKTDRDKQSDVKNMTGVFTGSYATHPFTEQKISIWVSDYVLIEYGTGAIMAVPGHDLRDQAFANKFELPIIQVVDQSNETGASPEEKRGIMIRSEFLNGLQVQEAIVKAIEQIVAKKIGKEKVQYRMRDANFSRQRYWGEPFPVYYNSEGVCVAMDYSELPLELPRLEKIEVSKNGKSPLAEAQDWVHFAEGKTRETDTMPGYAGSSWYFLRYMDPKNTEEFASSSSLDYWQDVDLYIGGTEHAVGHLMYSRFWHKFLYDLGYIKTVEPFKRLVNQGMIQGMIESLALIKDSKPPKFISHELVSQYDEELIAYIPVHKDFVKNYGTPEAHLDQPGIEEFIKWRPDFKEALFVNSLESKTAHDLNSEFKIRTKTEVGKMSKRYHNVVNPDDVIAEYGADCFRMYEMFLGPLEDSKPWDTKGISGVSGFLKKYHQLFFNDNKELALIGEAPTPEMLKVLHTCIKKLRADLDAMSYNTSVSAFMICVNELRKLNCKNREVLLTLNKLLAPFAPFITEEIYQISGGLGSVHHQEYPIHNESFLESDSINYPVSVNGKKRYEWTVPKAMTKEELESSVLQLDEIKKWTENQNIKKIILVPGRMINIVI